MPSFHRGTNRYVIALPMFGIVFKFPRIWFRNAYERLKIGRRNHQRYTKGIRDERSEPFSRFLWRECVIRKIRDGGSLKEALFTGFAENLQERRFYRCNEHLHNLLQPTYCSILFGLITIQKYGKPMKARNLFDPLSGELYRCYLKVIGPEINSDGHHFWYEGNFSFDATGNVRFLDYGGCKTQEILIAHGKDILERFVPPDPALY